MTYVTMTVEDLARICTDMAQAGAAEYVRQTKPSEDLISQREAFRTFGETRVRRWREAGKVDRIRKGSSVNSKTLYSLAKLIAADKDERIHAVIAKSNGL